MMIVIDSEFESLIPPLTNDEYRLLEESILTEGFHSWEPIITWNGTIIDGHNRYHICDEYGIKFTTREMQFESRDAAKIWIIKNQLGRRNLNRAQRMDMALKLESSIAAEAKRKHAANGGNRGNQYTGGKVAASPKSDTPPDHIHTIEVMADMADVGKGQMREYKEIAEKADEGDPIAIKEKEALLSGEKKSVHGSHMKVFGKRKPRTPNETVDKDGRTICAMCGEPINEGEAHPSRRTVHKKCEQEYQRDWEKEKRAERKKPQFTEDGRRICSICGEPIDEGGHYQDKLNWHYKCGLKHATDIQRKYRDADRDLRENVAVYSIDSLVAELTASAMNMRDAVAQSIEINESMGVKVTNRQKDSLNKAIDKVFKSIERMRG